MLYRLRAANLKLNPKKCEPFRCKVRFLAGHVVCAEGVTTDPDKVEAVKTWPVQQNSEEVKRFVRLCTYYRRFVRSLSDVARALHELTEKGQSFEWTKACEDSFQGCTCVCPGSSVSSNHGTLFYSIQMPVMSV